MRSLTIIFVSIFVAAKDWQQVPLAGGKFSRCMHDSYCTASADVISYNCERYFKLSQLNDQQELLLDLSRT